MATHSSVLAWRIPGTGEPGGLPSMGLHRVGHDWSDLAVAEWARRTRPSHTYTVCVGTAHRCSVGHFSWEKEFLSLVPPGPNPTDDKGKVVVWGLLKILQHSRKTQTAPRGVLKFIPTVGWVTCRLDKLPKSCNDKNGLSVAVLARSVSRVPAPPLGYASPTSSSSGQTAGTLQKSDSLLPTPDQ